MAPKTSAETSAGLLNVAEMLLHGVADEEILDNWLQSIDCNEFVDKFLDNGYTMQILPRATPQDLTAIGIREPTKRTKILQEIKKLNLRTDCIPKQTPTSLSHLLELLNLDQTDYYKQLCEQQIDTVEKLCLLTWEDFEELGITKLGHQKVLQIAIERLKGSVGDSSKTSDQSIYGSSNLVNVNDQVGGEHTSNTFDGKILNRNKNLLPEPIYDSNPSQILFMTSNTENHCLNGPIINKQSSAGEISSTGSDSLHSVYSSGSYNSSHQQPSSHLASQQSIYCQPAYLTQQYQQQLDAKFGTTATSSLIYQSPRALDNNECDAINLSNEANSTSHINSNTDAISSQSKRTNLDESLVNHNTFTVQSQLANPIYQSSTLLSPLRNRSQQVNLNQTNRDATGTRQPANQFVTPKMPFSAFVANLPQHHRQALQQSSVYATLTRQSGSTLDRSKRVPPPVPVRRESLRGSSKLNQSKQTHLSTESLADNLSMMSMLGACSGSDASQSSWHRVGSKNYGSVMSMGTRSGSHTLRADKNRLFNGHAYINTLRAKYLSRKTPNVDTGNTTGAFEYSQQTSESGDVINNCDKDKCVSHKNLFYSPAHTFGTNQQASNSFRRMSDFNVDSKLYDFTTRRDFDANLDSNRTSVPLLGFPSERVAANEGNIENRPRNWTSNACKSGFDVASDTRSVSSFVMRDKSQTSVTNLSSPSDANPLLKLPARDDAASQSTSSSETLHQSASFDQSIMKLTNQNTHSTTERTVGSIAATNSAKSMNGSSSSSTIISSTSNSSDNNQVNSTHSEQLNCSSREDTAQVGNLLTTQSDDLSQYNATTGVDIEFPPPPPPLAMFDYATAEDSSLGAVDLAANLPRACSTSGNGRLAVSS